MDFYDPLQSSSNCFSAIPKSAGGGIIQTHSHTHSCTHALALAQLNTYANTHTHTLSLFCFGTDNNRGVGAAIVTHELVVFVFESDLVSIIHDFVLAAAKSSHA